MDREALVELNGEQLLELVGQLAARMVELEAQVGRPQRPPGNSPVLPSAGNKPNREERW